jgi:F-type H+-transporting ATPase subunit delta
MRAEIIARNYAETLLELARRNGGRPTVEQFLAAMDEVAELLADGRVREFLATPRVSAEAKKEALRTALAGRAPEPFLRFLMVVFDKRRQRLLGAIAEQYRLLVDEMFGRVRLSVEISHAPDAALQAEIGTALANRMGKVVIPTFTVNPELLGGMVVRMGDEILDGSLQSRVLGLRRRLLEVELPHGDGNGRPAAAS